MDTRDDHRADAEARRQRTMVLAARRRRREAGQALRNRLLRNTF